MQRHALPRERTDSQGSAGSPSTPGGRFALRKRTASRQGAYHTHHVLNANLQNQPFHVHSGAELLREDELSPEMRQELLH